MSGCLVAQCGGGRSSLHRAFIHSAGLTLILLCGSPLFSNGVFAHGPTESQEDLKVYEFGDTLQIRGRIDELIGIAATASEGRVSYENFQDRPLLREAEVLETVPGLITTQHSGDGKSNQMFIRGFNLDHGTDFQTTLEGMPVNLPTHGHGQGYTDINFLVPELVDYVEFKKGVFHPELGDFGSAGGASLFLRKSLAQPSFKFEVGEDRYRRSVGAASQALGRGILFGGFEIKSYDGPWRNEQNLKKVSGMARYSVGDRNEFLSILAMAYDNEWLASDQIPQRAVESGRISRFGQIDETLGGSSSRYSLSAQWKRRWGLRTLKVDAYVIDYDLQLYSNFTYALEDTTNGDQFEQFDDRVVAGANVGYQFPLAAFGKNHLVDVGLQNRNDFINDVGLYKTEARTRLETIRQNDVVESSLGVFGQLSSRWHPRFRSEIGLRADSYFFDVQDDLIEANSGTESDVALSPKINLVWSASEWSELYLSAGLGFHSNDARGTVITVDPASGDPATAVDPLVSSRGGEIGIRTSPVESLRSTASLWTLELDSELVYVGDGGGTEASDGSRRFGVEWTNFYQARPDLALELDVAWSHARFTDVDENEDHIPGALENVVAAGVVWESPLDVVASLRLRHLGSFPLIEDDSVRASSTNLINGSLSYRLGRARLTASVLNITDEKDSDIQYYYESRLPGEPEGGVSDIHFHPVEPRQFRIAVDVGLFSSPGAESDGHSH